MLADYDSVDSRTSTRETCADIDRETVVSILFGSVSNWKRDRDQNVVQPFGDRQILHIILERKAALAVRGEKLAQQKLYEAETDVDVKHWERKIRIWLFMRSVRSSSPKDFRYNKRIDGQIRLKEIKISLHGELEMRNRLFREHQAKDCQEIEE